MSKYKRYGGWVLKDKLFVQVKVSRELWYFRRRDGSGEKCVHLFMVGWYEREGLQGRIWSMDLLGLSVQVGW